MKKRTSKQIFAETLPEISGRKSIDKITSRSKYSIDACRRDMENAMKKTDGRVKSQ